MKHVAADATAPAELLGGAHGRHGGNREVYALAQRMRLLSRWGEGILHASADPAISLATSHDEIAAIGRLRYERFIERDHQSDRNADNARRLLLEPVDDLSLHICVRIDGCCVAAIRLSKGQDAIDDPQLSSVLRSCGVATEPFADCLTLSRLVVRPDRSARSRIAALLKFSYGIGLMTGTARLGIFRTRPGLIGFFERFGCVFTGATVTDPVAGDMAILALRMHDRDHLRAANSPLLAELDRYRLRQSLPTEPVWG